MRRTAPLRNPNRRTPEQERELCLLMGSFVHDPEGHALASYPWGKPGTPLEHEKGLRTWQRAFLRGLGERLRAMNASARQAMAEAGKSIGELMLDPVQEAVTSGHGVGKSALVAMIVKWAMDTFEDTRGVLTANTEPQLRTKTWPELAKWHRMSLTEHWFQLDATAMWSLMPGRKMSWRMDIIPWDETRPEAFQGLHNKGKRLLLLFDEASGIHDKIWEAADGALTDLGTEILWFAFGNPLRTTGRFRECWGRYRARWSAGAPLQLDSRTVEGTNTKLFEQWIKDHEFDGGEDSDFVRVRVRGVFPKASVMQLISSDAVHRATKRTPVSLPDDPLIMGVDVARGGADNCVIRFRRGMDAASLPPIRIPGSKVEDSMLLVSIVIQTIRKYEPDAVFVDSTGVGGPILNRIRQLGYNAMGVNFGEGAPEGADDGGERCANMRSYIWLRMRDAIVEGLALPDDPILKDDLTNVEFGHDKLDRLQLERKEHMKGRGLASPDDGDALAVTFAYPVPPKSSPLSMRSQEPQTMDTSHNPYAPKKRTPRT